MKKIGEVLLENNLITPKQLEMALLKQKTTGYKVGSILVSMGLITEKQLSDVLSQMFGIPAWNYSEFEFNLQVRNSIPIDIIINNNVFPIKVDKNEISIVTSDPTNINVINDIEFRTNKRVKLFIAPDDVVKRFIHKIYILNEYQMEWQEISSNFNEIDITLNTDSLINYYKEELKVQRIIENTDKIINKILFIALKRNTDIISIVPYKDTFCIYLEKEEKRELLVRAPKGDYYSNILHRLKLLSNLPPSTVAQILTDGYFRIFSPKLNIEANAEISCYPTLYGELISIELKYKKRVTKNLENMGIEVQSLNYLTNIITAKRLKGIILITGEGMVAKELIYSIINKIYLKQPSAQIHTLEKCIEYEMDNILQSTFRTIINCSTEEKVINILKNIPNVFYLEEFFEENVIKEVIRYSPQNTLFLLQMPFKDIFSCLFYILSLNIPIYNFINPLKMVINVSKFKKLCQHCKLELDEQSPLYDELLQKISGKFKAFSPIGCRECNYSGYKDEVGVFDILPINNEVRNILLENKQINYIIQELNKRKTRNNYIDAMNKVAYGIIDYNEVKEKLL